MATNGSKASLDLKPVALIAGLIAAPVAAGAISSRLFESKKDAKPDADALRLLRNFGIFYALTAAGLGYASSRKNLSQGVRNAALGGALGTGLIAAFIGSAFITFSSKTETAPANEPPAKQPGGGFGGLFGSSTGMTPPIWTSTFAGAR